GPRRLPNGWWIHAFDQHLADLDAVQLRPELPGAIAGYVKRDLDFWIHVPADSGRSAAPHQVRRIAPLESGAGDDRVDVQPCARDTAAPPQPVAQVERLDARG